MFCGREQIGHIQHALKFGNVKCGDVFITWYVNIVMLCSSCSVLASKSFRTSILARRSLELSRHIAKEKHNQLYYKRDWSGAGTRFHVTPQERSAAQFIAHFMKYFPGV